jgi:acetyltransferase
MKSKISHLKSILYPKSVAVIGASREKGKIGNNVVENLVKGGFKGQVYPINPSSEEILGLKAYKNIREIPGRVDLAIIVVPAQITPQVMEDCVSKKVAGGIIISAGFSETGVEGKKLEDCVLKIAKKGNMRIIGPNCQGLINISANLFAWFGAVPQKKGGVGFITQSGALGGGLISWTNKERIGLFNTVVSLGNKCDIDESDLLPFFAEDNNVKSVMIYMEGIKNGRKFLETAKKATLVKPVIALKAGRSPVGIKAVASHTGSLTTSDQIFGAVFKQCGIVRANSVEEMIDYSIALLTCPYAYGKNIAMITNAGGPGVIAADLCHEIGLNLNKFSPSVIAKLREALPPQSSIENPVDITGDPRPERFKVAIEAVLGDDAVDGAIVIVIGPLKGGEEIGKIIQNAKGMYKKPIVVCWLSKEFAGKAPWKLQIKGIPVFETPERAVHAMHALVKYGMCLRKSNKRY